MTEPCFHAQHRRSSSRMKRQALDRWLAGLAQSAVAAAVTAGALIAVEHENAWIALALAALAAAFTASVLLFGRSD